jgi:multidrug efflux pump subunit AcrA (membrane-fusion protein)
MERTVRSMRIFSSRANKPVRWILGLGAVLLGALVLHSIVPTRAASRYNETKQQTIEKPAAKSAGSDPASPGTGKLKTVKVEKGPLKIEVALSGVFEAKRMAEVSIRPRAWALPLVVERATELGTPVKKGDILVEFDHDKIDKAIEDTEVETALGDLALKHAEDEVPILEKALPVDLSAALRAKTEADEDLKNSSKSTGPNPSGMLNFWSNYRSSSLSTPRKNFGSSRRCIARRT